MSKFEMLQTFTCVPKFEGLQTENFSNLRTSTVCRTHIGQKNMKGFPDQTRLVGRHTRELNLVYFFCSKHGWCVVPASCPKHKKQSRDIIACFDMVISRTVSYLSLSNCAQEIFFSGNVLFQPNRFFCTILCRR